MTQTSVEVQVVGVSTPIAARLEEIVHRNDGRLEAADVLRDAEDPTSPLHGRFEWDDSAAARAYRLVQAHRLVRSVRIKRIEVSDTGPRKVSITRRYVAERDVVEEHDPAKSGGYLPVETVARDTAYRNHLRKMLRADLERLRQRYIDFDELMDIVAEVFGKTGGDDA